MNYSRKTGLLALAFAGVASVAAAVSLENGLVRVEVGDRGELKALVCKATGHDWAGGAQLWRLYFDDRRGGHEEREVPVLGAEQTPTVTADAERIVLFYPSLTCRGKALNISLRLTV